MRIISARLAAVQDVGMGALYFFASHMVIRAFFHVGVGRTPVEMAAFLLAVMASVACAHVLAGPLLRLRVTASGYLRLPVVSLLAAVGALLELLAVLPVVGPVPLYAGGVLVGLACGWLVVIWMSSFHVAAPDPSTFAVPPALVWAVAFYFLFRVASTVSPGVGEGVLLALPLLSIACMTADGGEGAGDPGDDARRPDARGEAAAESRRSSLVLVCVSAAFAVLSSVAVHLAGQEGLALDSSLNYMTLFEALVVACVLCCCYLLRWFAAQRPRPRGTGAFVTAVLVAPTFALGLGMGFAYEPQDVPGLMWEVSLWVMLVAVFAYDLRETLYLARGLAVGLMFEAMCMGQMAMQVTAHMGRASWATVAAALVSLAYLAGVCRQLLSRPREAQRTAGALDTPAPGCDAGAAEGRRHVSHAAEATERSGEPGRAPAPSPASETTDELERRCAELGRPYFLTQSEVVIFAMAARGRSARYIADELGVSFNTVRTHIRHVYEKLGIHSKQELIDLVNGD